MCTPEDVKNCQRVYGFCVAVDNPWNKGINMTHPCPKCFKAKPQMETTYTVKISKCSACDYAWNCENAFKEEEKP